GELAGQGVVDVVVAALGVNEDLLDAGDGRAVTVEGGRHVAVAVVAEDDGGVLVGVAGEVQDVVLEGQAAGAAAVFEGFQPRRQASRTAQGGIHFAREHHATPLVPVFYTALLLSRLRPFGRRLNPNAT